MARKSVFRGNVKGEEQIFWNPADSRMSKIHTNGEENLNLSFFLNNKTNDCVTREQLGPALFDAIKSVIQLGGKWVPGLHADSPDHREYMELYITKRELRAIERAVMKGEDDE